MPKESIEELVRDGLIQTDPDLGEVVPVQLAYSGRLPKVSRAERKQFVLKMLEPAMERVSAAGGKTDLAEFSVSGQCVQAVVPPSQLSSLEDSLSHQDGLSIQVLRSYKAI